MVIGARAEETGISVRVAVLAGYFAQTRHHFRLGLGGWKVEAPFEPHAFRDIGKKLFKRRHSYLGQHLFLLPDGIWNISRHLHFSSSQNFLYAASSINFSRTEGSDVWSTAIKLP